MNEDDDEEENNNNSSSEEDDDNNNTYDSDNENSEDKVANSQSLLFVDYSIIQYNRVINIVRALYEPHSSSASDQHDDENNKSISGQKTAGHNSSKNELDKVRESNRLDNQMRHSFLIIYISILDNDGQWRIVRDNKQRECNKNRLVALRATERTRSKPLQTVAKDDNSAAATTTTAKNDNKDS